MYSARAEASPLRPPALTEPHLGQLRLILRRAIHELDAAPVATHAGVEVADDARQLGPGIGVMCPRERREKLKVLDLA